MLLVLAAGFIAPTHSVSAQEVSQETHIVYGPEDGSTINVDRVGFRVFPYPQPNATISCTLRGPDLVMGPSDCTQQWLIYDLTGLADGTYTFETVATAQDGTVDPSPATRGFILSSAVAEGTETLHGHDDYMSTDFDRDGARDNDVLETAVDTHLGGGDVLIREAQVTSGPPTGWNYYGQEVYMTAPLEEPEHPLWITFLLDSSVMPRVGTGINEYAVFRDGVRVPMCPSAGQGSASPDPCIATYGGGTDDLMYRINSTQGGTWNFGYPLPPEPSPTPSPTPTPSPSVTPTPTPAPSPSDDVAAVIEVASEVSMRFERSSTSFVGRVFSDREGCLRQRPVRLFKVRTGPDRLVSRTHAFRSGRWVIDLSQVRAGSYYARAARVTVEKRDLEIRCLAARGKTIRVTI